jgi:toxin YoeB
MRKTFSDDAWDDYLYWQRQDRKTLKRINALVRDIERSPFAGLGKPEPLRFDLSGAWFRRIDSANRLVYSVDDSGLHIYSLRDHY